MFIEPNELQIVEHILKKYVPDYEVRAFGSRVHGKNLKPFSDIDLVIMNEKPIPSEKYNNLKYDFSESDLPFRVDVGVWSDISDEFRKIITSDFEIIQNAK
jgi:predicted nucleotidyltransferase